MKKVIFALLAMFILANLALAGDENTPKTKEGDKAWLFTLGGFSNLGAGNFQGGVGYKWYLNDGNAIRIGLGFGMQNTTDKYQGPANVAFADRKISTTGFSISPGYLHSMAISGPINAYIGGQVSYAMVTSTDENPGYNAGYKNKETTSAFGIAALAGVEWFAWSNISFGAEYQLGFVSTSGTFENTVPSPGTSTSGDSPSTTAVGISSVTGGNLTLSVYW